MKLCYAPFMTSALTAGFVLAASSPVCAGTATFEMIPGGGILFSDLTPDGTIVAGTSNFDGGFLWTQADGFTVLGGSGAVALSDDSTVVLGNIGSPQEAALWTEATRIHPLTEPRKSLWFHDVVVVGSEIWFATGTGAKGFDSCCRRGAPTAIQCVQFTAGRLVIQQEAISADAIVLLMRD